MKSRNDTRGGFLKLQLAMPDLVAESATGEILQFLSLHTCISLFSGCVQLELPSC